MGPRRLPLGLGHQPFPGLHNLISGIPHTAAYPDGAVIPEIPADTVCVMDQVKDTKNTDEHWLEHIALKDALERLGEREKADLPYNHRHAICGKAHRLSDVKVVDCLDLPYNLPGQGKTAFVSFRQGG